MSEQAKKKKKMYYTETCSGPLQLFFRRPIQSLTSDTVVQHTSSISGNWIFLKYTISYCFHDSKSLFSLQIYTLTICNMMQTSTERLQYNFKSKNIFFLKTIKAAHFYEICPYLHIFKILKIFWDVKQINEIRQMCLKKKPHI